MQAVCALRCWQFPPPESCPPCSAGISSVPPHSALFAIKLPERVLRRTSDSIKIKSQQINGLSNWLDICFHSASAVVNREERWDSRLE
ncbi:hypothetical protein AH4AK4_1261 [Aeromonas hydrophila 4AK4]|nr:hypothetical protein AH4AK4_1261 [Aeromonas hydrophila 4AK4]